MGESIFNDPLVLANRAEVVRRAQDVDKAAPLGKCINPATGAPVSARRDDEALTPVDGSREDSADGNGTGLCPECSTRVRLSTKGYVTAHIVRHEPIPAPPASVRLAETRPEVTESGARTGSPDAAMRSRGAELSGAFGTGTVRIKVQPIDPETGKPSGAATQEDVPATEENIRTAIRQESRKKRRKCKKTGDMIGGPDAARLSQLGSMLRGATGLTAVPVPKAEPGMYKVREAVTWSRDETDSRDVRAAHRGERDGRVPTSPGAAILSGRALSSVPPVESDRVNAKGKPKNAIGWDDPAQGRMRVDPLVAAGGNAEACQGRNKGRGCTREGCPAMVAPKGVPERFAFLTCSEWRVLSPRQQRRYFEQVRTLEARGKRAAALRVQAEKVRDGMAGSDMRGVTSRRYRSNKADSRASVQTVGRA